MQRLFAFRWILPILQVTLFALLAALAQQEDNWSIEQRADFRIRTGHYYNPKVDLYGALNLPVAYVVGALDIFIGYRTSEFLQHEPFSTEVIHFVAYGIGVVILWYWVGSWLDGRLGIMRPAAVRAPNQVLRFLCWTGLVVCALLGGLAVAGITSGIRPLWSYLIFAHPVWFAFAALVLALKIRLWRKLVRTTSVGIRP